MQIKIKATLFPLLLLYGCSGDSESANSSNLDLDVSLPPPTEHMLEMRSICMACHQLSVRTLAPSIEDISAKYKNTDIDRLVATVKAGRQFGELTWGNAPMPPSFLPEKDIEEVIKWMLTQ